MDLSFSPEETAFRDEVRAFLRENLSPELIAKMRESGPARTRGRHALAQKTVRKRLGRAEMAGGTWRPRMEPNATIHF